MFLLYVTFKSPCRAHKLATSSTIWDVSTIDAMPVLGPSSLFLRRASQKKKKNTQRTQMLGLAFGFLPSLGVFSPSKLTLLRLILC